MAAGEPTIAQVRDQTPAERRARGKALRKAVPRSSHAAWAPSADRPDPVTLLQQQDEARLQWLVPVRHGRMSVTPFTLYRGSARVMAADLAGTPTTGLTVQLCGDAHLSNFGFYGSPERKLVFDCNDFDETLPGPWEWDLKRLAASVTIAGRNNGFDDHEIDGATIRSSEGYRSAMRDFARMGYLELWYSHVPAEQLRDLAPTKKHRKRFSKGMAKARRKDSLQALTKLAEKVDGDYRIASDPPVLVPLRDLSDQFDLEEIRASISASADTYLGTIRPDRAQLLRRFRPIDFALKVVGVGSVGTRCYIMLMEGRDEDDPLFLQMKEATASVLEDHLPVSRWPSSGRRVVEGQRLMQAQSDVFLGWTADERGHDYYWRQLKDMKGSVDIDALDPGALGRFAFLCGLTLARAHARSGDAAAISGYLGSGTVFDRAMVEFATAYADQNERDYDAHQSAIRSGRVETAEG